MKLINHTYDSLNECLYAMINGTVFWLGGCKIIYLPSSARFIVPHLEDLPLAYTTRWKAWQVQAEPDWRDDLPNENGIPCIVQYSINNKGGKDLDYVTSYTKGVKYPYEGKLTFYQHATPIQEKDCWRAE